MELLQSPFPVEVDLLLRFHEGPHWQVSPFRHCEGWLMIGSVSLETPFGRRSTTLVVAMSDHGRIYRTATARTLLDIPMGLPRLCEVVPPEELEEALYWQYWDFLGSSDIENLKRLEMAEEEGDRKISAFEAKCKSQQDSAWKKTRKLRREREDSNITKTRLDEVEQELSRLEDSIERLPLAILSHAQSVRASLEKLETEVLDGIQDHGKFNVLGTVRWCARSGVPSSTQVEGTIGESFFSPWWFEDQFDEFELPVFAPVPEQAAIEIHSNQLPKVSEPQTESVSIPRMAQSLRMAFDALSVRLNNLIDGVEANKNLDDATKEFAKSLLTVFLSDDSPDTLAATNTAFVKALRKSITQLEDRVDSLINSIEFDEQFGEDHVNRLKRLLVEMLT
jgi:hypothetical protein